MQKHHISALVILAAAAAAAALAASDFLQMRHPDNLLASPGLTTVRQLSDYAPWLKGTNGDTRIFEFDSGIPGGTLLLLGGTHPNEPAGFIAATVILENIRVEQGRVLVIPQACASGFTCTDPFEGAPMNFSLEGRSGTRTFRFGSRVSNPLDQWPDPLVYSHYPSGQQLSGFETRNLNRSYPGRPDGTFTEQVGNAIVELLRQENVDLAFDLHEAAPEIPIINAIVYHEKGEDLAMSAVLALEFEDMRYAPELSPANFRGLSHREWGDGTNVIPFLMETSNPIQGRLRGRTNADLIVKGVSDGYRRALESGVLRIEYEADGEPLSRRVGRHVQGFTALVNAYNEYRGERPIVISNLPSFPEVLSNGVGSYLN